MKKFLFASVIAAATIVAACSTQSMRSTDPAVAAAVRALVESRDYTIDVDMMSTSRGRPVTLSHPWNISVKGDSIYSYLPYMGEAYTPVIGRQDGLNFDGRLNDYVEKEGKRGSIEIEFWARTFEDRYDYRVTVFPGGASYIWVTPDRKSTVSFDGRLKLDEK